MSLAYYLGRLFGSLLGRQLKSLGPLRKRARSLADLLLSGSMLLGSPTIKTPLPCW